MVATQIGAELQEQPMPIEQKEEAGPEINHQSLSLGILQDVQEDFSCQSDLAAPMLQNQPMI